MLTALRKSSVEVQRCSLRSASGAHCDPELAKRIDEKLGEEDWRHTWQCRLARHLAKRIGEEEDEEKEEEEKQTALIKSGNPHLAGGELKTKRLFVGLPS